MVLFSCQGIDYLGGAWCVSQSDRQVAQPALVADAPDRRAAQPLVELGFAPGEELHQRSLIQTVPGPEISFRRELGKPIPWANQLAVVAAVNPVADQRPQPFRDGTLVLYGQIGNAAPRVELVGPADRLRRADLHAAFTGSTGIGDFFIHWQWQVAVDFAEEEPRAGVPAEQQGVLAAPSDAGARGELHFHHRRRVGEHPVAEPADLRGDAVAELLQPVAQHLVIVAPAGVAGDVRFLRARLDSLSSVIQVVHAAGDDAQRAGLELGRAGAERAVARHILHLAMPSFPQPLEQPRLGGGEISVGDADRLEAELPPPALDARA